jgi:hypothetical protein
MPIIRIDAFTVDNVANGHVRLPCDGTTTVPMLLTVSTRLLPGEIVAIVPVWIGSVFLFTWSTMVRDVMLFAPPPGAGATITRSYAIGCTNGCQLTPSGPGGAVYTPDGDEIVLKAAVYDTSQIWGLKWGFTPTEVKVSCEKRLQAPTHEVAKDVSYDSAIDEQLALLARKVKATDRLRVADDGSIVIDKRRGRDKV